MPPEIPRQYRHRRAHAHSCPACRRDWALRILVVDGGRFVACRFCGDVRSVLPHLPES